MSERLLPESTLRCTFLRARPFRTPWVTWRQLTSVHWPNGQRGL